MARVVVGVCSPGTRLSATWAGTARMILSATPRGNMPSPKSSAWTRPLAKADGPQPMLETDLHPALGQIIERRIDEGRREALTRQPRDGRRALPWRGFPAPRRRQASTNLRWGPYSKRREKTAATAARKAIHRSAGACRSGTSLPGRSKRRRPKIIERARARHPPRG